MQVLFVLRFYYSEKTDNIDHLIHALSSNMTIKMSSVVKQVLYVLKLFRVTPGTLFGSTVKKRSDHVSKVSAFGYDPKNPTLLWIIWINNLVWDFSKEMKYPFSD